MKAELAGFLVVYRDRLLVLKGRRSFDLPKGKIEIGEGKLAAARRELLEETGIELVKLLSPKPIKIEYVLKSGVSKTAYFYVCKVTSTTVVLSREHVGYQWISLDKAVELLPKRFKSLPKKVKKLI